jgi:Kef-type K+ transport system membrane component KefB
MSFGILALIVLAGLAGPLLASGRRLVVPVVVGELAAGVVIGTTGTGTIDPTEPTIAFMAAVGFAMLMFGAGLHVPVRQPGIAGGLRRGLAAAIVTGALAVPAGLAISIATGRHHTAVYALLLASGSAAILLPALQERHLLDDPDALTVAAQVGIADVAAIVALPLVMQPSKAAHAALGGLAVAATAVGVLVIARVLRGTSFVHRLRRASKKRAWALDLRLSLLVLFALSWLAVRTGTSVLIAGFAVGLLVAVVGGPKRLSRQVTGIASGFFVPLFFVVLGARLDLRALVHHPTTVEITVLLVALMVAIHVAGARLTGQPLGAGLAATAQLGLPAGVATLGLQLHVLDSGEAAAILLAALVTVGISAAGVALLARPSRTQAEPEGGARTVVRVGRAERLAPPGADRHTL